MIHDEVERLSTLINNLLAINQYELGGVVAQRNHVAGRIAEPGRGGHGPLWLRGVTQDLYREFGHRLIGSRSGDLFGALVGQLVCLGGHAVLTHELLHAAFGIDHA